ncbi:MAG TPA: peptidoglycan DD-metalloendopeptidase family protein [Candidatus Limnocylindrales bacterium]|nr:peptidoglycan DD-metalloendopeptidase family protein [Candidatus Limnocylindrales bacterium]
MTSPLPERQHLPSERITSGWTSRPQRARRRFPFRLLVLVFLIPLLTGIAAAPAAPSASAGELADARAAKASLEKKIAAQKRDIAELNALQAGLRTQIAQTTVELNGITADLDKTRAQVAAMKKAVAKVQAKYEELVLEVQQLDGTVERVSQAEEETRQQLGTRKALLAERIRSAYETNRTSLLETFLSGGSFTDILTEVSYYLDVGQQDKQLAEQIAEDQQALESLHDTVVESRAQTDELRAETAKQKAELDADLKALRAAEHRLHQLEVATRKALAAQRAAYAQSQRNKAAARRAMAAAAAAQRRLQNKIDRLIAAQASHGRIPSSYNGTLGWPMAGTVTQNFGCTGVSAEPPLGSCPHFHQGIDIVNAYGTPVHASGSGTVVYCGWNYADGADPAWIVIIAHSSNLQTWYAHMVPNCPVGSGRHVSSGQVIGHEGNTGHSTGPHLHWAVRMDGSFVNPRLFL